MPDQEERLRIAGQVQENQLHRQGRNRIVFQSSSGLPTGCVPSDSFSPGVNFSSRDEDTMQHGSFMSYLNNPFIPHTVFSSPGATTSNNFIDLDKAECKDRGGLDVVDNDNVRREKRLLWKQDEDVRLMSAWIKHSTDPRSGNFQKAEKYWGDVAEEYDLGTPQNRKRNVKQVKERWHKINRWANWFNDAWVKVKGIYTSGYSDDMWIEKSHKMYEEDHEGAKFVLMDVWSLCRYQAKWMAYNNLSKPTRKRKEVEKEGEAELNTNDAQMEGENDLPRPMGQKAAKRAAAQGTQGRNKETTIDVDALDRFEKIQTNNHANRVKLLEMQHQLTDGKEKASKLAVLAAREQKNAKLVEKEIKMLDTYNNLLTKATVEMSNEERAEHVLALKCLRTAIFRNTSSI